LQTETANASIESPIAIRKSSKKVIYPRFLYYAIVLYTKSVHTTSINIFDKKNPAEHSAGFTDSAVFNTYHPFHPEVRPEPEPEVQEYQ
jgi:hypothetical protein